MSTTHHRRGAAASALAPLAMAALAAILGGANLEAQAPLGTNAVSVSAPVESLDSLVELALRDNPRIHAARDRVEAARAGIAPASTRPDPMLMFGIQNLPISQPGFQDFMTMKMVGVTQTFPYPGKLALRGEAATHAVEAAAAELEWASREVARDVTAAYDDLAYVDQALNIVEQNRSVLVELIRATEAQYAVGAGGQQDVLRARVDAAELGNQASALHEQRGVVVAALNALLDRPSQTPIARARIPSAVERAAVADSVADIRFVSAALGARAADSPLPPLAALQEMAARDNPMIRAGQARIASQVARVGLARKAHLPDIDLSVQFGQRRGFSDMLTAIVSLPLPVHRASRQDNELAAASADLSAIEADQREQVNGVRAEVARLYGDLERDRTQLALFKKAVLPEADAASRASLANYQVGRADVTTLLDTQTTLFNNEIAYYRALSDFAKTLASLDAVVGKEILP